MVMVEPEHVRLVELEEGGYVVEEVIHHRIDGKRPKRIKLWGIILPLGGKWQPTDTEGRDIGDPLDTLQEATARLFEDVR